MPGMNVQCFSGHDVKQVGQRIEKLLISDKALRQNMWANFTAAEIERLTVIVYALDDVVVGSTDSTAGISKSANVNKYRALAEFEQAISETLNGRR